MTWLRLVTVLFGAALLICLPNCATSFRGSAQYSGGPAACVRQCRSIGGQMGAFIYMGDYSTGCVCTPPASHAAPTASQATIAGGGLAAVAGVWMQEQEEARRRAQR